MLSSYDLENIDQPYSNMKTTRDEGTMHERFSLCHYPTDSHILRTKQEEIKKDIIYSIYM